MPFHVSQSIDAPHALCSPRDTYSKRLQERCGTQASLRERESFVGWSRVALFLVILALGWFVFAAKWLSAWWLVVPGLPFLVLFFVHEQVTRAYLRASRTVRFYEAGMARLDELWRGQGQQGIRFRDDHHPYAVDLDLFGSGSLFERLCTARTQPGEDTLAAWLLEPARRDEVCARQEAVLDLRDRIDLREELALLGADATSVDFRAVTSWARAPLLLVPAWPRFAALAIGIFTVFTLAGWLCQLFGLPTDLVPLGSMFEQVGPVPFIVALIGHAWFQLRYGARVASVLRDIDRRSHDLALLARLLATVESATFASARLCDLQRGIMAHTADGEDLPPSRIVARLGNLLELLDSRRNQFFAPFAYLLLWSGQMAFAIDRWRAVAGSAIGHWLSAIGEFEAFNSLAAYAYENPEDPFPEVVGDGPIYEGEAVGHPLLPATSNVRNDIQLNRHAALLVISGSNMSGKSTFLRSVGINAVLALAGGPVRAKNLRLSPVSIGATLRIQDSLQEGKSRFYAEVLRVRQVVELANGDLPLLFLLDEIFAGTNSHDRRIGAEAVVRGLVDRGAIGLVTTHDLSLTQMVEQLAPRATNVHFADHFENGVMKFDYRMQPGVVRHSNALELMRAVGLEV